MTPRVSVVMPALQAERTIGAAVSSVLQQTYTDLELVVVDDGSTDATGAIAAAHAGPVEVVRQENAGVAAARNAGIERASGELIAFCDADDILLPGHLEALVAVRERHGGIATANCYWLFPGGIDPSRMRYKGGFPQPERQRLAILEQNFVSTMSLFPKRLVGGDRPVRRRSGGRPRTGTSGCARSSPATASRSSRGRSRSTAGATPGCPSARDEMDAHIEAILRSVRRADRAHGGRARVPASGGSPARARGSCARGDEALRAGRYGEAPQRYRERGRLVPSERPLVWKARVLARAPRLDGPLVRARQQRIERRVGFGEGHVR